MAAEIMYGLKSYLTFKIGTETFAVNIGNVTKILELSDITKVPNSHSQFKGIINHFGDVLPVFDGRIKFGFPTNCISSNSCILVLVLEIDGQPTTAGIVVDSVEKILNLESPQIQAARAIENGFNTEFIYGMATVEHESVFILDIARIFLEEEND